ncbi:MAG: aspartyl protease family protein [Thermoanaerobaculia bacterium]
MRIRLEDGLPFVEATIVVGGKEVELPIALLDTGSAGTLVNADRLLGAGVTAEPTDRIGSVRGIGGVEYVLRKRASEVRLGALSVRDVDVQVGALDYGFDVDAIIGADVLCGLAAVIDLGRLELAGPD